MKYSLVVTNLPAKRREIKAKELAKASKKLKELNAAIEACIKARQLVPTLLYSQREKCMRVPNLDDDNSDFPTQKINLNTFIDIPRDVFLKAHIYESEKKVYEQELHAINCVIEKWVNDKSSGGLIFVSDKDFGPQIMEALHIDEWVALFDVKDLQQRKEQLNDLLNRSTILPEDLLRVTENSTVTVVNLINGKEQTLSPTGERQMSSPLGRQLIGSVVNETLEIELPKGKTPFKVKEIR